MPEVLRDEMTQPVLREETQQTAPSKRETRRQGAAGDAHDPYRSLRKCGSEDQSTPHFEAQVEHPIIPSARPPVVSGVTGQRGWHDPTVRRIWGSAAQLERPHSEPPCDADEVFWRVAWWRIRRGQTHGERPGGRRVSQGHAGLRRTRVPPCRTVSQVHRRSFRS